MKRTQISAGTVVSVGYEAATLTLELEMDSGEVFRFFNVPLSTYIGLMNADSKDNYFQHTIRPVFESKQITEDIL